MLNFIKIVFEKFSIISYNILHNQEQRMIVPFGQHP